MHHNTIVGWSIMIEFRLNFIVCYILATIHLRCLIFDGDRSETI